MARGRIINSKICMDRKVNELSDDTSRLAFTWLITFADCEGRTPGEPIILCSMLFPRRRDMPEEQMEGYIREWAESGMVVWYKVKEDMFIEFLNFEDNQPNLRKDREAASVIPSPAEGEILAGILPEKYRLAKEEIMDEPQDYSGPTPELLPLNIREENIREEKISKRCGAELAVSDFISTAVQAYENDVGLISGSHQRDEMLDYINTLHEQGADSWWQKAIDIAADNNKRSWAYIRAILDNSLRDKRPPGNNGKPQRSSRGNSPGYVVGPRWS